MNLWFRVLWLFLTTPLRPKIAPPFGVSRLRFRVWPLDLDTNLHMNNGRYLTIADQGRADLLLRSGLWRAVLRHGWLPMLSGSTVRYRRELKPFERFELLTRIVFWNERNFVMEHRFVVTRDGRPDLAAIALVRGGLYDRKSRSFVPASLIFREAGYEGAPPEATAEVAAFMRAEDELKRLANAVG